MQQDQFARSKEDRRIRFIKIAFTVLIAFFVFRLLQRQVFERSQFQEAADKQYYTKIDQPARRGDIYIKDRDNQNLVDENKTGLFPVANDLELYNLTVIPKNIIDKKATAKTLADLAGLNEADVFNQINNDKLYLPPLKKRMTKEETDKIAALNIKGVYFEGEYSRFYPEKEFLSQVLGFVDSSSNGRYGEEEYYDGVLKGEGGELKGIKDNLGRIVQIQDSAPGKDGQSIVLTIDRSIQYMAEKKLQEGITRYGAEGGTIIIMDAKTGAIWAMASSPSYDPNTYNEVPTDKQSIFLNPATGVDWEPGSIFKPLVVAAALKDKKIEPDSKPEQPFGASVTVDGYEIHNSQNKPFGFETVTQILENSDNVGMVWIAQQMGSDVMYNFLKSIGFGEKTGLDIAGEAQGQMKNAKNWKDVNRATISFGQGIAATPLQIVQAYSIFANKGKLVKPHILDSIIQSDGTKKGVEVVDGPQILSEDEVKKMNEMLVSVVVNGHGKKAQVAGFRVAGKTGTAQIPKKDGAGYETDTHIGSFAGYAPADDAKFVMLVKFDKPKTVEWAESSAAPIFGEISDWLLNSYLKVPKTQ